MRGGKGSNKNDRTRHWKSVTRKQWQLTQQPARNVHRSFKKRITVVQKRMTTKLDRFHS